MRKLSMLILCIVMMVVPLASAQEGTRYEDPQGRFSVPIPDGWQDLSSDEMAHFYSSDPLANLYVVPLPEAEALALVASDVTGDPIQEVDAPLSNGLWVQRIYMQAWDLVLTLNQGRDGVSITVVVRGQQDALAAVNDVVLGTIIGIEFGEAAPPPYAVLEKFTEQEVSIGPESAPLGATLALPIGDGPFPAVVIVHGSGPSDRDGTVGPNKLYRDIAWGLASQGVAVLRYDKRTLIYPEQFTPQATVREESIDDTLAALTLLRTIPAIDSSRLYVLGHSLGGGLAPTIAQEDEQVAGLIIMAGSNRSLLEMVIEQGHYLAALDGDVSAAETASLDELQAAIDQLDSLPDDAAIIGAYVGYWRALETLDTLSTAQALNIPMLVLQGGRDYQVTEFDFGRWQEALSGRANVQFILYPMLNHEFMAGEGAPNPDEYYIPGFADAQVINDIALWIQGQ